VRPASQPLFRTSDMRDRIDGHRAVKRWAGVLIADLLNIVRFERVVAVDLHTASLEGFFSFPLEHLSAVPLLTNEIDELIRTESVIVASDLGGR
jgi:ribose-phosphate pyrophosphokinase